MWWLIGCGCLVWVTMQCWLDGPGIPAWQARNNYRLMNAVLLFLLVLMAIKGHGWLTELVTLIPFCSP